STLSALARNSYRLLQNKVIEHLVTIRKNMEQAAELDSEVRDLAERISSNCYEIEDLEGALRVYRDTLPMDSSRLEEISTRLAQLKQLQRKYGPELEDVLAYADRAEKELDDLIGLEDEIDELELALEEVSTEALLKATELTEARRLVAAKLSAAMEIELESLHFSQAVFEVSLRDPEGMGMDGIQSSGRDQVEFLFSANPGEPAKPLVKVVSGGELSRLMLAMKCILARRDQVDTVIFDEVDAGIGGQAAEAVAIKISELAAHHQVFCITHLPQIAAHASTHYLVEKTVEDGRTTTSIRLLNKKERVRELARMLGGENPSEQTLAYAGALAEKKGG
ncbi:MAG: DNA repair protein RecN, partial [Desulfobulbaceae bacterium]|nr:DNA repair protein RecN [Desulfobulbaceae bacterium]